MRVQQFLFSSFHFTWLSPEQHIHEWTERKMSKRGQMIAIRVFLCNYVIIFVWKPYPSLMHSAPLPGGSCSSPVTKCVVARRRGGTQGWGRHGISTCSLGSSSVLGTHGTHGMWQWRYRREMLRVQCAVKSHWEGERTFDKTPSQHGSTLPRTWKARKTEKPLTDQRTRGRHD